MRAKQGALRQEPAPARSEETTQEGASESAPRLYSIGELGRLAQVSPRTIRYYEEIGLLKTARRYSGGRRAFDADALERLRFIGRLKRLGFTLAEISHLNEVFEMEQSTAAMLQVLARQLARHQETIDTRLNELHDLRAQLGAYREHVRRRLDTLPEDRGAATEGAADGDGARGRG